VPAPAPAPVPAAPAAMADADFSELLAARGAATFASEKLGGVETAAERVGERPHRAPPLAEAVEKDDRVPLHGRDPSLGPEGRERPAALLRAPLAHHPGGRGEDARPVAPRPALHAPVV
ncbi:MAG: hypothetical protein ACK55I_42995, partial [bacterium]